MQVTCKVEALFAVCVRSDLDGDLNLRVVVALEVNSTCWTAVRPEERLDEYVDWYASLQRVSIRLSDKQAAFLPPATSNDSTTLPAQSAPPLQ